MSRIRSIHPGLFTDEGYMALSPYAMAAWPGIWVEADDQGVFEWKPLTLKARLLPCAPVDMAALLTEYEAQGLVKRFEVDEHHYGAIRNFRKFQRPEKPKNWYPLPEDLRAFVGLSTQISRRPVADEAPLNGPQSPTGRRKPPQMEDVGGKREEVGGKEPQPPRTEPAPRAHAREAEPAPVVVVEALAFEGSVIRLAQRDFDRWKARFHHIDLLAELEAFDAKLVDEGFEGKWFARVAGWLNAKHQAFAAKPGGTSRVGEDFVASAAPYAPESPAHWRDRLRVWFDRLQSNPNAGWPEEAWGPPIGDRFCQVPAEVLAEFRGDG